MRKYCKKMFAMLLILAALAICVIPAGAASGFTDVAADSPWYESVSYLAGQGITNGVGNLRYAPDEMITIQQWAAMLCRAFDGEQENYLAKAYHNGWLSTCAVMAPDSAVCRGELYQSAFAAGGVQIYDFVFYPNGKPLSAYENGMRVGAELGICEEDTDPTALVSRGEAAEVLYAVLTRDLQVEAPPMLKKFPIQNKAGVHLNDYLLELKRVPEAILQKFQSKGWTYTIDFEYLSDLSKEYHASCTGATSYAEKRIYVSEAGSTLHEFGHFVHYILGFPDEVKQLYADEAKAAAAFLRDYAMTNSREYFADYFVHWINSCDNAQKMVQMQQLTSQTYLYFNMVAEKDWKVFNNKK
ncbi:MAG: S-layer homology domain-containing protein [Clostridiaceae bacterium]|nr:S-layer homology domain-containing protein [Clostridiaceae bacterium]